MTEGGRLANLADLATVVVAAAALVLVGTTMWDRYSTQSSRNREIDDWQELARESHWQGPEDAQVVILEFGDYECPFCRRLEPTLASLRATFPEQVAVAYRHYPLSQHAHAYRAAVMAECGAEQGRFAEVHALLYETPDLAALEPNKVASDARIPRPEEFFDCTDRPDEAVGVERDLALARRLEVRSTPTVIVNGTLLSPAPTPDSLESMVRRLVSG